MQKAWLLLGLGLPALGQAQSGAPRVAVIPNAADRRVDVLVDGKPFPAYIYPTSTTLKKPTLYPLRTASGKLVTRGWPLEPRPGERVDHPHHVGLWFTYSDVNGLDFWNNSDAIPAARAPKMGTIVHRAVRRAEGGAGQGVLERSEEHTSELQSLTNLVCRLLLEKKKKAQSYNKQSRWYRSGSGYTQETI